MKCDSKEAGVSFSSSCSKQIPPPLGLNWVVCGLGRDERAHCCPSRSALLPPPALRHPSAEMMENWKLKAQATSCR